MRFRLSLVVVALSVVLLAAGCSQQPVPAPTVTSLTSSSVTLAASGGSTTLSWSGTNVTDYGLAVSPSKGVKVNGSAYSGSVDLSTSTNAIVTLPSNGTSSSVAYNLTLTAAGGKGTTASTKTVKVTVGAASPSVASFTANPTSLGSSGGSSTLSWSGSAVTGYSLTVNPSTGVQVNGTTYSGSVDLATSTSATVTLPSVSGATGVTYTFTLTASGVSGTTPATNTVTVAVGAANPAIGSFSANPTSLGSSGGSTTLTWTGSAVTDYSLTVSPSTGVEVNGTAYSGSVDLATSASATVTLPGNTSSSSASYTFTLTASGASGTTPATNTATATVRAANLAITSFSANPTILSSSGGPSSLSWTGSAVTDYNLTVSPTTGVKVNGTAYAGAVDVGTSTSAQLTLPANTTPTSTTYYSVTLTASGTPAGSVSKTLILAVDPVTYSTFTNSAYAFAGPAGIAADSSGNVWVVNSSTFGAVTEIPSAAPSSPVQVGGAYTFDYPIDVAVDAGGNIWVANYSDGVGSLGSVSKITTSSKPPTILTYSSTTYAFNSPRSVAIDGAGNVWTTNVGGNSVTEIPAGSPSSPHVFSAASYGFKYPYGLAVDDTGNVWVTNEGSNSVTMIPAANPTVPHVYSGAAYGFNIPQGIAVDSGGDVWVTSIGSNSLTEIPAANPGNPKTYAGSAYAFDNPVAIAVDGADNVWVVNMTGNSVTLVPQAAPEAPRVYSDAAYGFDRPLDLAIDNIGNLWVSNSWGSSGNLGSVTELVAVAQPLTFKAPLGP